MGLQHWVTGVMVTKAREGKKTGEGEGIHESGPLTEPRGSPIPKAQGTRAIGWDANYRTQPVTRKKKEE